MKTDKLLTLLVFLIMLSIFMFGCDDLEITKPEQTEYKESVLDGRSFADDKDTKSRCRVPAG